MMADGVMTYTIPRCYEKSFNEAVISRLPSESETYVSSVFTYRPFYWGECTCGFEKSLTEAAENNKHSDTCVVSELQDFERLNGWTWSIKNDEQKMQLLSDLLERHGLTLADEPYFEHCTCGSADALSKFEIENSHDESCLLEQWNFEFAETGFCMAWYKYPLRGAYANTRIDEAEFEEMMDACRDALGPKRVVKDKRRLKGQ